METGFIVVKALRRCRRAMLDLMQRKALILRASFYNHAFNIFTGILSIFNGDWSSNYISAIGIASLCSGQSVRKALLIALLLQMHISNASLC